jgi:hypothetical protein
MAVTWTISTLERNLTDDGVIVAHWRATDSEVVGDDTHTGSSYGTCGFTPDAEAEGFTAYEDITEAQAIGWVKDSMGEEGVAALEASIAAQIEQSKAPAVVVGTPW